MRHSLPAALLAAYHRLTWILAILSVVLLALLTVGIAAEAVMRSLRLGLVYGIVDFSEHAMFCLALLPAPWLLAQNGHISVDLVVGSVSRPVARALALFTDLAGLAICAAIAWYGVAILRQSYARGEFIIQELVIPEWWLQWQVPLVFALLSVEFALRLVRRGRPAPSPMTGL